MTREDKRREIRNNLLLNCVSNIEVELDDDTRIMKRMIDEGADLECRKGGMTPLLWAADFGLHDKMELLIDSGADLLAVDDDGLSALHKISMNPHSEKKFHDLIEKLVKEKGVDVNMVDKMGNTPLNIAVDDDVTGVDFDNILKLIECGADVNLKNESEVSPLMTAVLKLPKSAEKMKVIEKMFEKGGNINVVSNGFDLLGFAAISGDEDVLQYIIGKYKEHGLSLEGIDGSDQPTTIALAFGKIENYDILVKNGARPIHQNRDLLMRAITKTRESLELAGESEDGIAQKVVVKINELIGVDRVALALEEEEEMEKKRKRDQERAREKKSQERRLSSLERSSQNVNSDIESIRQRIKRVNERTDRAESELERKLRDKALNQAIIRETRKLENNSSQVSSAIINIEREIELERQRRGEEEKQRKEEEERQREQEEDRRMRAAIDARHAEVAARIASETEANRIAEEAMNRRLAEAGFLAGNQQQPARVIYAQDPILLRQLRFADTRVAELGVINRGLVNENTRLRDRVRELEERLRQSEQLSEPRTPSPRGRRERLTPPKSTTPPRGSDYEIEMEAIRRGNSTRKPTPARNIAEKSWDTSSDPGGNSSPPDTEIARARTTGRSVLHSPERNPRITPVQFATDFDLENDPSVISPTVSPAGSAASSPKRPEKSQQIS